MCWQLDQSFSLVEKSLLLVSLVCFTAPLTESTQAGATCSYHSSVLYSLCTPDFGARMRLSVFSWTGEDWA